MMYVWGHSYEFTDHDNWEVMENFCRRMGGREDIWLSLIHICMERSVVLLKGTNMRVNDISKKVGYENPSHYCAVFRKQMGVTPNQFRSKLTGKGAL